MHPSEPLLVFDIGGTKVAAAVLEPGLVVSSRQEMATQAAEGPEHVAGRVAALGHAVLESYTATHAGARPRRAGVASAGQIDRSTGTVSYATFHLPGWIGFPLGQRLAAGLGIPVVVDNDVNCHALAEAVCGAGQPYRHFLLAAIGTGVGGGVVIDRQVYRGRAALRFRNWLRHTLQASRWRRSTRQLHGWGWDWRASPMCWHRRRSSLAAVQCCLDNGIWPGWRRHLSSIRCPLTARSR